MFRDPWQLFCMYTKQDKKGLKRSKHKNNIRLSKRSTNHGRPKKSKSFMTSRLSTNTKQNDMENWVKFNKTINFYSTNCMVYHTCYFIFLCARLRMSQRALATTKRKPWWRHAAMRDIACLAGYLLEIQLTTKGSE